MKYLTKNQYNCYSVKWGLKSYWYKMNLLDRLLMASKHVRILSKYLDVEKIVNFSP